MLAYSQDKAVLDALGIGSTSSSSSESRDEGTDRSDCEPLGDSETMPDHSLLTQAQIESNLHTELMCLESLNRQSQCVHNALERVMGISQLILYSPKCSSLFDTKYLLEHQA